MKEIKIDGTSYIVFGKGEDVYYPKPHIANKITGEIPEGAQRGLLLKYLENTDIEIIDGATTYWCIGKILSNRNIKNDSVDIKQQIPTVKKNDFLELTEKNIEEQHNVVLKSTNYGKEAMIIHDVLNAYPLNNDINTIAMKISVIDVTNSTHLAQYKSQLSLYDLAKVIYEITDFDERLAVGDPELVNIIARNNGSINMFSFASKYCTYHNVEIYQRDDYSIFDGIVRQSLPYYLDGVTSHKLGTWRQNYDYQSFNDCIGKLLDENNITIPFRRRKFDHFLWYANRKKD